MSFGKNLILINSILGFAFLTLHADVNVTYKCDSNKGSITTTKTGKDELAARKEAKLYCAGRLGIPGDQISLSRKLDNKWKLVEQGKAAPITVQNEYKCLWVLPAGSSIRHDEIRYDTKSFKSAEASFNEICGSYVGKGYSNQVLAMYKKVGDTGRFVASKDNNGKPADNQLNDAKKDQKNMFTKPYKSGYRKSMGKNQYGNENLALCYDAKTGEWISEGC